MPVKKMYVSNLIFLLTKFHIDASTYAKQNSSIVSYFFFICNKIQRNWQCSTGIIYKHVLKIFRQEAVNGQTQEAVESMQYIDELLMRSGYWSVIRIYLRTKNVDRVHKGQRSAAGDRRQNNELPVCGSLCSSMAPPLHYFKELLAGHTKCGRERGCIDWSGSLFSGRTVSCLSVCLTMHLEPEAPASLTRYFQSLFPDLVGQDPLDNRGAKHLVQGER